MSRYSLKSVLKKEPAALGTATAATIAVAAIAVPIPESTQGAIVAAVIAIAGLFVRSQVAPVSSLDEAHDLVEIIELDEEGDIVR